MIPLCVLAAACASPATSAAPAAAQVQASPPPASVRDIGRVHILCLVAGGSDARLQSDLCARLQRLVSAGAPVPVTVVQLGDPAVLDPAALNLLLHASLERIGGAPVLALSLRSFRNAGPDSVTLFGPAPRAVPAGDATQIERALAAALTHVLPWRVAPQGARPID